MTYSYIKRLCDGRSLPLNAENESGEMVVIEGGKDDNGEYYRITTVQKNDWRRVEYIYKNGDRSETYEK